MADSPDPTTDPEPNHARTPQASLSLGALIDEGLLGAKLLRAAELSAVDELPPQRRMARFKRGIMRTARLYLTRQRAYNEQVTELLGLLNHQLVVHAAVTEQRYSTISAAIVEMELRFEDVADGAQRDMLDVTAGLEEEIAALRQSLAAIRGTDATDAG